MTERYFLRELRVKNGYFTRKVARDLSYSRSTLYRKELGKTALKKVEVVKFAEYYNVDAAEIEKHYKVVKG